MARSHGILKTEIWNAGSDYRQLTLTAQWAYAMLISQPQITNCGVQPYQPHRWQRLAAGLNRDQLNDAIAELRRHLYIVLDEETNELLVRTFIRHDRVWRQPNLVTNARREHAAIESPLIRQVLAEQHPWLEDNTDPKAVRDLEEHTASKPLPEPLRKGLSEPLREPLPSETPSRTPSGTPQRARDADDPAPTPAPSPPREGASGVHAAAADSAQKAPSAADTHEPAPTRARALPDPPIAEAREPVEPVAWNDQQALVAELYTRGSGWQLEPPELDHQLDRMWLHIPDDQRARLHDLAEQVAAAEAGAVSSVPSRERADAV